MRSKNELKERFKNLEYVEIGDEEREIDWKITTFILNDKDMQEQIKAYNCGGQKCAYAVVFENHELDAFISNDMTMKEIFNFKPIHDAIDFYDPGNSICIIYIRYGKVTASVVGIKDDREFF